MTNPNVENIRQPTRSKLSTMARPTKQHKTDYNNDTKPLPKKMSKATASLTPGEVAGVLWKYDGAFKQEIGAVEGGPQDLLADQRGIVGQYTNCCAAGRWCHVRMPLSLVHRCMSCAFSAHPECTAELTDWQQGGYPSISTSISLICYGCTNMLDMQTDLSVTSNGTKSVSIRHPKITALVRKSYPKLRLDEGVELERETSAADKAKIQQRVADKAAENKQRAEAKRAAKRKAKEKVKPSTGLKTPPPQQTPGDNMDIDRGSPEATKKAAAVPTDVEMEDDGSHSTAAKTNKNTDTSSTNTTTDATIKHYKGYLGVQLQIEPLSNAGNVNEAVQMVLKKCQEWMQNIQSITPTFKIHTADPTGDVQTVLHSMKDFPKDLGTLKRYFFGAAPRPKGGRIYLKILAEFEGTMKEFIQNVKWFHDNANERIYECQVQAFETKVPCWLLYSTRNLDIDRLKEALQDRATDSIPALHGYHMAWKRIPDGTWAAGRDTSKDPKGLLVEVDAKLAPQVKASLSRIYGNSATTWPLGIRMRYVSSITELVSLKSIERYHFLRNRQAGWTTQMQSVTIDSVVNLDRPHAIWPDRTLRMTIMAIPSSTGNINTSLFSGIDKPWKGSGYIVNFHPQKSTEARAALAGLYARFAFLLPQEDHQALREFFTPEAVSRGIEMTWNPDTNEAHSPADQAIDDLIAMDADMDFVTQEAAATTPEVFQADKWGTDDATLNSTGTKLTRPSTGQTTPITPITTVHQPDDASDASSLTVGTKATMNSRISKVEDMIAGQNEALNGILRLVQQLSAPSAPPPSQGDAAVAATPITPSVRPRTGDDVAPRAGSPEPAPV